MFSLYKRVRVACSAPDISEAVHLANMAKKLGQVLVSAYCGMLLLLCALVPRGEASRACNACGPECVTACGTAMFRACCFNYNRKRSGPTTSSSASEIRDMAPSGGGSANLDTTDSATFESRSEAGDGMAGNGIRQDAWALFWMLPARQRQPGLF
ncbi:trissin [Rhipicephalus microplus]|uniref:trissin n=1 Tax=Rhipicephalus microplus TaxID=6941 RepID=UPI003F6D7B3B